MNNLFGEMASASAPQGVMNDTARFERDDAFTRQAEEMSVGASMSYSALYQHQSAGRPRSYDTTSITHSLRRNLLNSNKNPIFCGRSGLNMTDGQWEVNAKLASVLGIVPGTKEYAQVAYRQAELELRRLQEVKPTYHSPSSRSMTPFDAQRPDEFGTASMSDDECESDDAASQYTSLSRLGVLTKGLRQAMEQWKKNVDANDDKQDVPLCGGNQ